MFWRKQNEKYPQIKNHNSNKKRRFLPNKQILYFYYITYSWVVKVTFKCACVIILICYFFLNSWHSFDDKEKQKLFQFVRTDLGDLNKLMEDKLRVIILLPYIAKYDLPRIVVMHFFSQPVRHVETQKQRRKYHIMKTQQDGVFTCTNLLSTQSKTTLHHRAFDIQETVFLICFFGKLLLSAVVFLISANFFPFMFI